MAGMSGVALNYANEKLRGEEPPPEYELPRYRAEPPPSATEARHSIGAITAVVAFYWVVSLSLVFLNKFIFSSSEYKFPYPLFVTWYQLVIALLLLILFGELGKRIPSLAFVAPFQFNWAIAQRVFPLTLCYVGMLAFNNICLKYVEVTFYQVARSLSIIFNIIFTYVILGKTTSTEAIISCLVIFAGFLVGSYGEINFSWIGILSGVASSCFVALYGIYVKKTLAVVENNEWILLHYNTAMATAALLPLVWLSGEAVAVAVNGSRASDYIQFDFLNNEDVSYFLGELHFWVIMTITAGTGFLINVAIFLQIKVTTPLTNTISGTAKACVQTLLGWLIFQNFITSMVTDRPAKRTKRVHNMFLARPKGLLNFINMLPLADPPIHVANGLGILLSLGGSGWYGWIRYKEMSKK